MFVKFKMKYIENFKEIKRVVIFLFKLFTVKEKYFYFNNVIIMGQS